MLKRARLLVEQGEHQRGLLFLGDDDLTSVATALVGIDRPTTVVEVDSRLVALLSLTSEERGWDNRVVTHDLRAPLPSKWRGKYGCVFTDPPYSVEGFSLFVSRAVEVLKPDGRLYVCFGHSRRARERGLQKQKVLADAGLLVEQVLADFNRYEGAESIGSKSALWVLSMTPKSKPLIKGQYTGELYTSRAN